MFFVGKCSSLTCFVPNQGAPRTDPNTVIAHVELEDGTKWGVQAGIKGFVVEINQVGHCCFKKEFV